MKKSFSVLTALLLTATMLVGCGQPKGSSPDPAAPTIDLCQTLESLLVREDELGLNDKYESVADITQGYLDEQLLGQWRYAGGMYTYTFSEDGQALVSWNGEDDGSQIPYTCLTIEGHHILCNETTAYSYPVDGDDPVESVVMSYSSYLVDGDVLYMVNAEDAHEGTSFSCSLLIFYRVGSSAEGSLALNSLTGQWQSDEGEVMMIGAQSLTFGKDTYAASFNGDGQLVVTGDGASNAYSFSLFYLKNYTDDTKTAIENERYGISLSYLSVDAEDKPNLSEHLDDWHSEYGGDNWYYSSSFFRVE